MTTFPLTRQCPCSKTGIMLVFEQGALTLPRKTCQGKLSSVNEAEPGSAV